MSTLTRRLTGVAAILAMLLFLAGVPMLLVAASRAFLPAELPAAEALLGALLRPDDGTFLVGLLVVAGWVVWAAMVVLVLIEVVAALRGVTAPTLPGLRAPQHAIRRLVLTAALAFLVVPAGGQAALAVPGPAPEGVTTHSVTAGDGPGSVLDADGETGGAGAAAGSAKARPGGGARSAAPAGDVRPATHTRPAAVVAVSPTVFRNEDAGRSALTRLMLGQLR